MDQGLKSFLVSMVTGSISQGVTILTLYLTKSPVLGLLVLQVFGTLLAYGAQNYIYGGRKFLSLTLLKWLVSNTMVLFLSYQFLMYFKNLSKIKELKEKMGDKWRVLYDYGLIMLSVLGTFLLWELPMRKNYIFNRESDLTQSSLLILMVVVLGIIWDHQN